MKHAFALAVALLAGCSGEAAVRVESPPAKAPPPPAWETHEYADLPPPPDMAEEPGKMPQAGHVWFRGHWAWRGGRFRWIGGRWGPGLRGYVWVDGRWERRERGWEYVPGHWSVLS